MTQENKIQMNMTVSGGSLGNYSAEISVEIDFSDASQSEIIEWASSNRKIALQRVLRQLTPEELEEYRKNGLSVKSHECGKKIESREEKVKKLENAGLPRQIAELAVDNPEKMEQMVANLNNK